MRRNLFTLVLLAAAATVWANPAGAQENSPLGKPAHDFCLPDVLTGKEVKLSGLKDKVVVVVFYSHGCTFCRNYEERFRQLAANYVKKNVVVLGVDSTGRPAREAAAAWKAKHMGFLLLRDERARTAAALGATAMTTVCIVDARGTLRYLGAFDDCESGQDVRCRFAVEAVNALLAGTPLPHDQSEVYGCMIPLPQ